jgi:hypothetical protein
MAGSAASLLVLLAASLAAFQVHSADLQVTNFVKYPGSSTAFDVAGVAYITSTASDGTIQLTWDLTGVDSACPTGTGNVCGIHIHTGLTCSNASLVGGHLYEASEDPWTTVRYSSTAGVSTNANGFVVPTGLDMSQLLGRALVVHNSNGAGERIACGIVEAMPESAPLSVDSWVLYPGSSWAEAVSGSMIVIHKKAVVDTVLLTWDFYNTDPACATGSGNVCGIHIHSGTTCDDAALVGGHYWNASELTSDPWTEVRYAAMGDGRSVSLEVPTVVAFGESRSSIIGRAMVVHNSVGNGERIACGIIQENPATTTTTTPTSCAGIWGQCGGSGWTGLTCCIGGTTCTEKGEHYSQCLPNEPDNCVKYHGKCGGSDYAGPTTCCIASQQCEYFNDYYSGCRDVPSRRLAAESAIHV